MGGGRSCSVIGCSSRSNPLNRKRFYGFPIDQTIRDVWTTFTRRGSDYVIKSSSYICEDHFDPSCFVFKKKQICLAKDTIPTIFNRMTPEGESEKIVLTFDRDIMHYVEEDTLLNPVYDKEKREEELIAKRDRKIEEIGKLCRFCLEDRSEENLIEISKLKDYSIKPTEVMSLVGLSTQYSELFSNNACEECFQQIFVFDGYRKRCQKAQERMVSDIKQLEQEIQRVSGIIAESSWLKGEATTNWNDDELMNESLEPSQMVSPVKSSEPEFHQITVKQERKDESTSDDEYNEFEYSSIPLEVSGDIEDFPDYNTANTSSHEFKVPDLQAKKEDESDDDTAASDSGIKKLTQYEDMETSGIVEGSKQHNNSRIFECFFCRIVSFDFIKIENFDKNYFP
jgi:THAP domain/Zinc-finger associated domain (zf-AD)